MIYFQTVIVKTKVVDKFSKEPVTTVGKIELNMSFLPTKSQSNQNLLALEPLSLFVEPERKILINVPSLCINRLFPHPSLASCLFDGHTILQYFAQDLVIYEPPSLQHSTRSLDLILGQIHLASLEFSLSSFHNLSFPVAGQQTLFQQLLQF